jgi:hypothetical protein
LYCNGAETCVDHACQAGTAPCVDADHCDEINDTCLACISDAECSDGLYCNGAETCVDHACQAGTPPNCADEIACTVDACDEETDACTHTPNNAACDDGLFCNGAETCDIALGCVAGSNPCPGQICDEIGDTCVTLLHGDLNCDGAVNLIDIPHFVQAVLDQANYMSDHDGDPYPSCDWMLADMNVDTVVDGADIQGFVAVLVEP